MHDLLQADGLRPWRLEPLVQICRNYRRLGQFHLAHLFSSVALQTPYPADDVIFIEKSVYEYELLLEHALACKQLGDEEQAKRLGERILLGESSMDEETRAFVIESLHVENGSEGTPNRG